ncbi:polysaccharide deacetylase [Plectosphaerella plurivora]|uniref:Polysaccharide deacetylase n=1 Tax=Plectosphaerella plurivora TaxID=936078 RepID=A0A9P8VHJ3_9PEZI|nr:polysaccharide deacetylase [Plectosphaerella plurivora]
MYSTRIFGLVATLAAATCSAAPFRTLPRATTNQTSSGGPAFGQIYYNCITPGQVALTFDDGPYTYTNQLLDVLASYDAKATFFLNGQNFGRNMDQEPWASMIRRMYEAGHHIASHTLTHADLSTLSSADRAAQMSGNDALIRSIIGVAPTYMRAPYLSCAGECLAELGNLGYHVIDASLDTKDYENQTPDTNGASQAKFDAELGYPDSSAPIVLAHDVHETTVSLLTPHMIETLRARGFKTVTVGECLGDAPANWYRS